MTTVEPAPPQREPHAISAEDLAWEGSGRRAPPPPSGDALIMRVEGFEGPLDWPLEQARAGRVDLARLSVLALIEQCVMAIDAALAQRRGEDTGGASFPPAMPLQRLSEWLVMAAWLTWLRSRLLLPVDDPEGAAAREEAEALRRQLVDRERIRDAVAWLDARAQLGRDVFARGGVPARPGAERAADLPALLRTYARLMGPLPQQEKADAYRPRPLPLWRVPDAIARIRRLLPEMPYDSGFERFLPAVAPEPPEYDLRCRSAVASTLVAGLELAREGQLTLGQGESFGPSR